MSTPSPTDTGAAPSRTERARNLAKPFRDTNGKSSRLADVDPNDPLHLTPEGKPRAKEALALGGAALVALGG